MKYALINRPSAGTFRMLAHRVNDVGTREHMQKGIVESIGICQGTVLEILVASDVAEKSTDVVALDVNGNCPQHITCLAVCGSTSAVKEALQSIRTAIEELP